MPVSNLIDARLFVNGKALEEYLLPDGDSDTHDTTTRYVEIEAGQHFEVKVRWMAGFNIQYASYLLCEVAFDNWGGWVMSTDCGSVNHRKGIIHRDICDSMSRVRDRNEFTGEWQCSQLAFGAFGTSDEAQINISPQEVLEIGSIRLTCYRALQYRRKVPYVATGIRHKTTNEVPEYALKGKVIKNNIRLSSAGPALQPDVQYHAFAPIKGKHGKAQHFVFLYRSRKILQSLGCIPRSPSPPPDTTLMLERTEEQLKVYKQREREANLKLLRLQEEMNRKLAATRGGRMIDLNDDSTTLVPSRSVSANINIKKETSDSTRPAVKIEGHTTIQSQERTTIGPNVGSEDTLFQGTKRKRDDDDDDDLREMAPPPRKPCMIIDLTEDD